MKKIMILFIFLVITMTSCVSKHPKCAAYDNIQTTEVK